jgi:hypothetical protein
MNGYLRSFVIGASFPVFILWYISVSRRTDKKYSYELYSMINPLYFGLMNMLSLYLSKIYGWDLRKRLFIISVISATVVCAFSTLTGQYVVTHPIQYYQYCLKVFIGHLITYNVIIYYLEKHIPQ